MESCQLKEQLGIMAQGIVVIESGLVLDLELLKVIDQVITYIPSVYFLRPNRTISKSYWIQEYNYIRTFIVYIFYLQGTLGTYRINGFRNGRPRYVKYGGNWPSWGYPTMYLTWHHKAWAVRAQTWSGPSHPLLWKRSSARCPTMSRWWVNYGRWRLDNNLRVRCI